VGGQEASRLGTDKTGKDERKSQVHWSGKEKAVKLTDTWQTMLANFRPFTNDFVVFEKGKIFAFSFLLLFLYIVFLLS